MIDRDQAERVVRGMMPLASADQIAGYAAALRSELAALPAPREQPPMGTAFIKLALTDASLGAVRDQIEMAIGDGVRRALAKIEVGLDGSS